MTITFNIKKIRKEKKILLKTLARKSGISITEINDIERNLKMPTLITAVLLANALGVKVTDLYTENE